MLSPIAHPLARCARRSALAILVLMGASAAFPSLAQGPEFLSIKGNTVNIRAKPSTQSDVAWELIKGYPVQIMGQQDDWIKVKDFEGPLGWVHRPLTSDEPHFLVKADTLNLRAGAGTQHPVVTKLKKYDIVKTLEKQGEWAKVLTADGHEGWLLTSLAWGW